MEFKGLDKPLPCICCGLEPEPAFKAKEDRPEIQPYGATMFDTSGHYGSTVFDSMNETRLCINVCDDCLRKHADRCRTAYTIQRPFTVFQAFDPGDPA